MTDRESLEELFLARHPLVAIQTFEEEYVLTVLGELAVERQIDLWIWSATDGIRDGLLSDSPAVADTDHAAAALYWLLKQSQRPAMFVFCDLLGFLKDERTLRCLREAADQVAKAGSQIVLLDQSDALPAVVAARAARFVPSLPDEHEIESMIRNTLRELNEKRRIDVRLNREELQTVVRNLQGLSRRQARQVILDVVCVDCRLDASDINRMLARKRQAIAGDGLLDYVESPVNLDEIGGLGRLKAWLDVRKRCGSDEAAAFGITPPRGILLLGIQGAGKSLAAKAVATAWRRPLLRMDAGALYDRYIGES